MNLEKLKILKENLIKQNNRSGDLIIDLDIDSYPIVNLNIKTEKEDSYLELSYLDNILNILPKLETKQYKLINYLNTYIEIFVDSNNTSNKDILDIDVIMDNNIIEKIPLENNLNLFIYTDVPKITKSRDIVNYTDYQLINSKKANELILAIYIPIKNNENIMTTDISLLENKYSILANKPGNSNTLFLLHYVVK